MCNFCPNCITKKNCNIDCVQTSFLNTAHLPLVKQIVPPQNHNIDRANVAMLGCNYTLPLKSLGEILILFC